MATRHTGNITLAKNTNSLLLGYVLIHFITEYFYYLNYLLYLYASYLLREARKDSTVSVCLCVCRNGVTSYCLAMRDGLAAESLQLFVGVFEADLDPLSLNLEPL